MENLYIFPFLTIIPPKEKMIIDKNQSNTLDNLS